MTQQLETIPPSHQILVGTCNWADHTEFYPRGIKANEKISYYARFFPIVEVDSTFYHPASERNSALWAERTPADFLFTVKAYKELTLHDRTITEPSSETFKRFASALQPLADAGKLVALHFQFPPWFSNTPKHADYLRRVRQELPDAPIVIEFRHKSWANTGDVTRRSLDLLRRQDFAFTMVDAPQVGTATFPPVSGVTNPKLALLRFHGRNTHMWYAKVEKTQDRFNYLYSPAEVTEWVAPVEKVAQTAEKTIILFNNNARNYAVRNAKDMIEALHLPIAPALEAWQPPAPNEDAPDMRLLDRPAAQPALEGFAA